MENQMQLYHRSHGPWKSLRSVPQFSGSVGSVVELHSIRLGTFSRAVLRWSEAPPSGEPRRYGENGWMPGKTLSGRA